MNASNTSNDGYANQDSALDILCNLCIACFDDKVLWVEDDYRHHHDVQALAASSQSGCHLCSLILSQISDEDIACLQHDLHVAHADPSNQVGFNIRGSSTRTLWVAASNSSVTRKGWDTCKGRWTALARLHVRLREDDYTNEQRSTANQNFSESSIAQVSHWMEICQSDHSRCRDIQAVATIRKILPGRLLDLTSALESNQIKLCSSKLVGPNIRYSTLSHCWGGECEKKLIADNLATFQQGLAVDTLPQTFQDAVHVTRRLGLYYLWIDALCIIQDSDDDWRQEAAIMGDVYANSYITLAASTSPNSDGGLLHKRTPRSVWPCRLVAKWRCFTAGELVVSVPDWASEKDLVPLSTRAWVFQEFVLSKRFLYFGKDQVRWQCYCLAASEVYPDYSSGDDPQDDTYGLPAKSTILHLLQNPQQAAESWIKLREDYSRKALTRPTDRLPALTGIARMIHRTLNSANDDYLAGIWKPRLREELLWQRDSEVTTTPTPTTSYIAPTWSWASIQYPFLRFHLGGAEVANWRIRVVDANVIAVDDIFGAVTHGALILKCSLSYITATSQKGPRSDLGGQRIQWAISAVNSIVSTYKCSLSFDNPTNPASSSGIHTFCFMPIRASFWSDAGLNTMAGLLLQESGQRQGQYNRIGLLNIFSGTQQQVLISDMEKGSGPGETSYLETASRADRIIEIV